MTEIVFLCLYLAKETSLTSPKPPPQSNYKPFALFLTHEKSSPGSPQSIQHSVERRESGVGEMAKMRLAE